MNHLLKVRREKLANLQAEGNDPFVNTTYDQTHHAPDIKEHFEVKNLNKSQQAALCYKFQKEINHKYLNAKFYYEDEVEKQKNEIVVEKEGEKEEVNDIYRPRNQERFRDLCLLFWEIEEENTLKPNKCLHLMDKFSEEPNDKKFWVSMKEFH
jgi:hypothetical protein